ncbi:MAG: hypothetical protein QOF77_887 [Solirubrobacteraceae bacterium]|nr:hypothetical protein [Solirubrobacteraceae bacterium]
MVVGPDGLTVDPPPPVVLDPPPVPDPPRLGLRTGAGVDAGGLDGEGAGVLAGGVDTGRGALVSAAGVPAVTRAAAGVPALTRAAALAGCLGAGFVARGAAGGTAGAATGAGGAVSWRMIGAIGPALRRAGWPAGENTPDAAAAAPPTRATPRIAATARALPLTGASAVPGERRRPAFAPAAALGPADPGAKRRPRGRLPVVRVEMAGASPPGSGIGLRPVPVRRGGRSETGALAGPPPTPGSRMGAADRVLRGRLAALSPGVAGPGGPPLA